MRKLDGLKPGTIMPNPIKPPASNHGQIFCSIATENKRSPDDKINKKTVNVISRFTISFPLLPSLPASRQSAGTVPTIHPTKNQRIIVSYPPSKKLTTNDRRKMPVIPPTPPGKKYLTFSLKFF